MQPGNVSHKITVTCGVLAVCLSLLSLGISIIEIWPPRLLSLTEPEASSLSIQARLTAESALRNSILTALGGLVATAVAAAALRQASLAHRVHMHQKSIEWSKAFAESSKMLGDDNFAIRVSGVLGLRALAFADGKAGGTELVAAALSSFLRNATHRDEDAIQIALEFLSGTDQAQGCSLKGAHLAGMNLTKVSLSGMDLEGASFRSSAIKKSDQQYLMNLAGVDLGEVTWIDG